MLVDALDALDAFNPFSCRLVASVQIHFLAQTTQDVKPYGREKFLCPWPFLFMAENSMYPQSMIKGIPRTGPWRSKKPLLAP